MLKFKSALYSLCFILIFISSCNNDYEVAKVDYQLIKLDSNLKIEDDSIALEIIAPYKHKLDSIMGDTIGYSSHELIAAKPEGTLNNFVADLLFETANKHYKEKEKTIDFCIINYRSLRKNISKGIIKRSDVFELMPFDNKLVVLELLGNEVKEMLNYIAKTGGQAVSGIKMGIKSHSYINVLINGVAFNEEQNYTVLTYDYLAAGGDDMTFFKDPIFREDLNILGRDAIIEFIIDKNLNGKEISSFLDRRIYNEK